MGPPFQPDSCPSKKRNFSIFSLSEAQSYKTFCGHKFTLRQNKLERLVQLVLSLCQPIRHINQLSWASLEERIRLRSGWPEDRNQLPILGGKLAKIVIGPIHPNILTSKLNFKVQNINNKVFLKPSNSRNKLQFETASLNETVSNLFKKKVAQNDTIFRLLIPPTIHKK